jgi:signal peptidase I
VRFCLLFLCLAYICKSSVLEAFFVPSASMSPTLQEDDYILVPKFSYGLHVPFLSSAVAGWSQPKRGDVIVFKRSDDPRTGVDEGSHALVKRVIAVGGDLVEVRRKEVFVNGVVQSEPFARWGDSPRHDQDFPLRRVPEGMVFVLGDNRDESHDSRSWSMPFVKAERVLGRAVCIYWSAAALNRMGTLL